MLEFKEFWVGKHIKVLGVWHNSEDQGAPYPFHIPFPVNLAVWEFYLL